jgi:hypothetical protein
MRVQPEQEKADSWSPGGFRYGDIQPVVGDVSAEAELGVVSMGEGAADVLPRENRMGCGRNGRHS